MSTQFKDDSFSEIKSYEEALQDFLDFNKLGTTKSFHVGSSEEIKDIQKKVDFQTRLDGIEKRLSELENKELLKSHLIYIPTNTELIKYGK